MTTWDFQEKSGTGVAGWEYNENNLEYNSLLDPDSGNTVYYNGFGLSQSWSLLTKTISLLLTLSIIN
jgi:hypothetical protein